MIYRKWTFQDILRISELEKECFSEPWSYRMFADAFSSRLFYGVLAEDGGELAGYACETVLFENAEIDNIAVAKGYRRQGVGAALLRELEREARELDLDPTIVYTPRQLGRRVLEESGEGATKIRKLLFGEEDPITLGENAQILSRPAWLGQAVVCQALGWILQE